MSFTRNELVLLPVPFNDLTTRNVRPAVIIGHSTYPGDVSVVPVSFSFPSGMVDTPNPQTYKNARSWRVRLSVQDTALSRLKDGFDSRTRYQNPRDATIPDHFQPHERG